MHKGKRVSDLNLVDLVKFKKYYSLFHFKLFIVKPFKCLYDAVDFCVYSIMLWLNVCPNLMNKCILLI